MQQPINPQGDKRRESLRGFAIEHQSLDELEPNYQDLFREHLESEEKLLHIINAPSQRIREADKQVFFRKAWSTTPEWILVLTDQRGLVVTLQQDDSYPQLSNFPYADILSMELGRVLLYAWVDWRWTRGDRVKRIRVFFNAVGEELFDRIVKEICQYRIDRAGHGSEPSKRNLHLLDELPYKFKNLITYRLLLKDEAIDGVLFCPAVWIKVMGVFPKLKRPAFAILRTNFHVLLMREEFGHAGSKYGVVFRYFPLDAIERASLHQQEDETILSLFISQNGATEEVQIAFNLDDEEGLRTMLSGWLD